MRNILLFHTVFLVAIHSAVANDFPGIKTMMTEEEFNQAGLNKQSPEELAALNQWLIRYTANESHMVAREVEVVKEEAKKEIRSTIDGAFTGWGGDTVFRLTNGQVWKQRLKGRWKTNLNSPEVVIKRNFFGFHEMRIADSKRKIGVKRVR